MAAGFKRINPPGNVLAAELKAILHGVEYGLSNTRGPWRVFSGSIEVIHAVCSDISYKGVEEDTIREVKKLFSNSLVQGVWYYKRTLNQRAHG